MMVDLEALVSGVLDYLPVFIRVTSFLFALPIWGRGVPPQARLGLGAAITLILAPVVPVPPAGETLAAFFLTSAVEALVGLAMGLVVTTVMMAVYLAGQLIDVPMGFGMVNVMDPQMGAEIPIVAQFQFVVAILIFFLIDGHHGLFRSLAQSFAVMPVGGAGMSGAVADVALEMIRSMFLLGFRIALPVVAALFLTDVALGIVARAVPQINVFFVGFPLKVGLGMVLLIAALPAFVMLVATAFGGSGELGRLLDAMVRALGGV